MKVSTIDFNKLAKIAKSVAYSAEQGTVLELVKASQDPNDNRIWLSGEQLLAVVAASGGTVANVERDDEGELVSFQASGAQMNFSDLEEFTGCEPGELVDALIDSIQATAGRKITGDLAQTSVGAPIVITGSTTASSAVITSPSSTSGLAVGNAVSGAGIPVGATIASFSPLTLSASATATASGVSLTVQAEMQVIGLAEWTIDWKRKTAEATTTDDSAYESSLGSSASWSVKAKYIFLVGDSTQSSAVLAAISAPQAPQKWNFFPDILAGDPAFSGLAYIDGITLTAGTGKIVGLDVSLKGTGPLTVGTQAAPIVNPATITDSQAEV